MKRFGVSLPKQVAEEVERLSQEIGVTRSEIVAAALQEYLESRRDHVKPEHNCMGIVLALSSSFSDIGEIIESYKPFIVAYTHLHVEGKCLTITVVRGDGGEVEKMVLEMGRRAQVIRYVPLE
ncbi:CopG family ribbon-helix-helix protein [Pyrobaculum aerophilum]|uniref:Conserved (Helix-turn-helix protein, copG family) n=2 Tax=Pyrobaculum aerophilum TaxID=13773 RepID=Q8ZW15_PYRAE|nr:MULTISPECIES: CopG family ribbon-helix-helix protein [Pyrobaculum]AAL63889.1 conserved (helix-turn-helix protein, copG family) [Pyrobaculum aerophilum str. IM2]MCX8137621.1 CopG family ribbon-helix-helix protein [Pyrobaculum aerophilum]HII46545.1 CopG family ribbon-helix-helix protein [Pyrobaculum aerophilum]